MVEEFFTNVQKRDGRFVPFNEEKIANAIFKAAKSVGGKDYGSARNIARKVTNDLRRSFGGKSPTIEEVQDSVEKILIEDGRAKTAKAFILYRDERKRMRSKIQVRKKVRGKASSTDLLLLVEPSSKDELFEWSKSKIASALHKEASIPLAEAEEIADAVEERIFKSGLKKISTSLIRALVDTELFDRGYQSKLEKQTLIGMPVYDLKQLISSMSNENSNVAANNPEAVNLSIAENILKQFALNNLFSKDISKAHLEGAIHLHDLGYPIRTYCSAHSLEYIKKYGLKLENLSTVSAPAKHAQTLTGHLNTFLASMQAYYAGALGISYVNLFYAPLMRGMSFERMKQEAQYLIFSCSQNAFSRGGQTLFIDFNIHTGIPSYLKNVPAIGPGGKYMLEKKDGSIEKLDEVPRNKNGELEQSADGKILTYLDFEAEAQQFCRALMEVWREGDRNNLPFPFPKFDLHVNQDSFDDPKQRELLSEACVIASENGSPYFIFDRDEVNLSMCCRLRTEITDNYMVLHPESMRFCGFQNVSINLPQAAFKSSKNTGKTIKTVEAMMDLAVKAHLQKKKFIDQLMSAPHMPLWQIGKVAEDGRKYVDTDKATYIIGIIGLNECVKYLTDKELHESEDAYKEGLKIISAMYLKVKALEKEHKLKFTLEETPAESASSRMAKVDLRRFDFVKDYVQGDVASENVYYTNSVHFSPNSEVDIIERIDKQAKFNTLIESGAITHVFLGEQKPDPAAIFELVKRTWDNTPSAQIVISPEFTICKDCDKISRGFVRSAVQGAEEESSTEKEVSIKKENSGKLDKSNKSKKSVAEVC